MKKFNVFVVFSNREISLKIRLTIDDSWSYVRISRAARKKLFCSFRDTILTAFEIEDLDPVAILKEL